MKPTKNALGEEFYFYSTIPNEFFSVVLCGRTLPNPMYAVHRSCQPIYVIEYVISGRGWIECGGQKYEVQAGDFYFLRRGASVHYYADKDDPFDKIWINFRGSLVDGLVELYGLRTDVFVRHQTDDRICQLITDIHSLLWNNKNAMDLELMRQCSVKVMEILSIAMCRESLEHGLRPISTAEKIQHYIEMHLYEGISLDDIAEYFNLHKVYTIRLFRERFGMTPMKYLSRRRIEVACRMIEEGQMSFKEIAAALHFADGPYFSGRFKKEMGVSPTEYREALENEQKAGAHH
ncbi:MAG: AraC family transcriptional regulator [Ruminococcaceae bacterium]|nr:AraC family transcriptional regulator [Oscillospiraceae bacterium]